MTEKEKQLTDKQEAFVAAYCGVANFNATYAAELAGYSAARASGHECLTNPHIKARINAHLETLRGQGIANKAVRIAKLNKLLEDLEAIQRQRSEERGDDIGLMAETMNAKGTRYFVFDKDLVKSMTDIMEQTAKEVGDRNSKIELDAKVEVSSESAKNKLLSLLETTAAE